MEVFAGLGIDSPFCSWDEFANSLHGKLGRNNWQSLKAKAEAYVPSGDVSSSYIPSTLGRTFQFPLLSVNALPTYSSPSSV